MVLVFVFFQLGHLIRGKQNLAVALLRLGWRRIALPNRFRHYDRVEILRHAAGLTLRGVDLRTAKPDARPALVVDDATDLKIFDSGSESPNPASPVVWLRDVDGAFIQSCRASKDAKTFLRVDGAKSAAILMAENNLDQAEKAVDEGNTVPAGAVRVRGALARNR
jgi:hypothetical protein